MGCTSSRVRADDGSYDPSSLTLKFGTSSKSNYKKIEHKDVYTGDAKVLVVCTDDGKMKMKNDKVFNTGNHPIEMLLPMMHLRDAGFSFEIATASGSPVVFEMWAYPTKDKEVISFHEAMKAQFDAPKRIEDIPNLDGYAAIFIPGGHGSMINLPQSASLGALLRQANKTGLPTVTLCHGPSALLSTAVEGDFAYDGYTICCFTQKTDDFTPKLGYLPGKMPWDVQSTLEGKGVTVTNKKETGQCTTDRELITGDSPKAANNLGVLAAPIVAQYAIKNFNEGTAMVE
jgi:molecular chaperone Hsp31 and glyoxalase 3